MTAKAAGASCESHLLESLCRARPNASGQSIESTFQLGADIAAITHGHPTGYLTAGTLALIIAIMLRGATVPEALSCAKRELLRHDGHLETMQAIALAEKLSRSEPNSAAAIQKLGQGRVAEEALAISLYCALCARDFEQGVVLAVNHDGDSDSTGRSPEICSDAVMASARFQRDGWNRWSYVR